MLSGNRGARGAEGNRIKSAPVTLGRCLGLPANPERARIWLRDAYLRQAAQALAPGAKAWGQACALHPEALRFLGHEWPCWWNLREPPATATEVERLLWLATRAGGGKLPGTARRLHQILAE